MNLLDRAIAALAPQAGLRRLQARAQLGLIARQYDAATRSRRTSGWYAPAKGAVLEVQSARALIRDRARDLVRNNAWAHKAVRILAGQQIGTGIVPRAATPSDRLNKQIDDLWAAWADACSPHTGLDFYGIQMLAARSRAESGESLVRMWRGDRNKRLPVPLSLQVLETDWLVEDHSATVMPQSPIREGIVFGADGSRAGYNMYRFNPNDWWQAGRNDWEVVPAEDICHLYRIDRPGQLRGVSDLASVALRMRDLDEFHDAALLTAKIQAMLGVFVTTPDGPAGSPLGAASTDDAGRLETLEPGMVGYLRPGENVQFLAPAANAPFSDYSRTALHAIAAGFGITYHMLTGDLRDANYSSLRAGTLEVRRTVEQDQWLTFIPQVCRPVWQQFIRMAIVAGKLPTSAENAPAKWAPPRFELVDPMKDTAAIIAQVRAGLKTMPQAMAEMGDDWKIQLAEIKTFNAAADAAGIVLDTDPRRVSSTGAPNDPAQLAKIELQAKE